MANGGKAKVPKTKGYFKGGRTMKNKMDTKGRSEEHTSELQSRLHLVCRLLLEKKKIAEDSHCERTQESE